MPSNRDDLVDLTQRILQLVPRDDAQRWFQSQALQLVNELSATRGLLVSQLVENALPTPLLIVLIVWTTAIFIGFGMFARMNLAVIVALSISAVSVAAAIFLILELDRPFTGLIHVSSASNHELLAVLGK